MFVLFFFSSFFSLCLFSLIYTKVLLKHRLVLMHFSWQFHVSHLAFSDCSLTAAMSSHKFFIFHSIFPPIWLECADTEDESNTITFNLLCVSTERTRMQQERSKRQRGITQVWKNQGPETKLTKTSWDKTPNLMKYKPAWSSGRDRQNNKKHQEQTETPRNTTVKLVKMEGKKTDLNVIRDR